MVVNSLYTRILESVKYADLLSEENSILAIPSATEMASGSMSPLPDYKVSINGPGGKPKVEYLTCY